MEWLKAGAVHCLASDAHNITSRPLRLKEAFDYVTKKYGEELARALLLENPLAVFEGRPLPHVPELAADLGSTASDSHVPRRKKRFWFF